MKKVGELLRTEREKKGLSLHEIGLSLKINPKILKAIEDGDTTQLPAKTFLRGFIRSYAQYLKLNVEEVLEIFSSEFGTTKPEVPIVPNSDDVNTTTNASVSTAATTTGAPTTNANSKTTSTNNSHEELKPVDSKKSVDNLLMLFLGIGLLVFIALIINQTNKYQKEKETAGTDIESGVVVLTTTTLIPANNSQALSTSATTTTLPANSGSSAVSNNPSVVTTTTVNTTSTTLKKATPITTTTLKPKSTTTTMAVATTAESSTVNSSTTTTTLAQKSVEVIIEALNKVTIRYATSPGQWQTVELEADQVHIFKSKTGIELEISDGGAVSVVVNGKDRGVQGVIGKPLKLKF